MLIKIDSFTGFSPLCKPRLLPNALLDVIIDIHIGSCVLVRLQGDVRREEPAMLTILEKAGKAKDLGRYVIAINSEI